MQFSRLETRMCLQRSLNKLEREHGQATLDTHAREGRSEKWRTSSASAARLSRCMWARATEKAKLGSRERCRSGSHSSVQHKCATCVCVYKMFGDVKNAYHR